LHITSAVLPATAKDTGRSVVTLSFSEEPEKTFSVVSLKLDSHESQTLDLLLDEESVVKFNVSGKNPVHLSGYYVPGSDDGEDFYDDEVDSDEVGDEDGLGGLDEEDDVSDDDEMDQATLKRVQAALAQQQNKRKAPENGAEPAKKPKQEQQHQQQPQKNKPAQPAGAKPQQQQGGKPQQPQQQKSQAKGGQQHQHQNPNQQHVLPGGLQITTLQEGTGQVASKGMKVGVKYIGRLTKTNKVFDASQKKPFTFTLGAGEVIKGWDLGVAGMKVGEKRKLVIPAEQGYGREGAGRDIPPNSSLTFDVELVHVK